MPAGCLPRKEFHPTAFGGKVKTKKKAPVAQNTSDFFKRIQLGTARFMNMFKHAYAEHGVERGIGKGESGVFSGGSGDKAEYARTVQNRGFLFKGISRCVVPMVREECGKVTVAARPVQD